jgi:hypothetical protein
VTPAPSPLQQLCAMGHARDEARAALAAYDGDLAQAGQALLRAALQRGQQETQAAMEGALRQEKARADAAVATAMREEQVAAGAAAAQAESEALLATVAHRARPASGGSAGAEAEPEPEPDAAPTPAQPGPYARELSSLRVKALKQRAKVLGATPTQIDDIDDAEDTKGAAVALVVSLKAGLSALRVKELKKQLRAAGIGADIIDDLDDNDDPKAAAIEMLLQVSAGAAPAGPASAAASGSVYLAGAQAAVVESHGQRAQVVEPSVVNQQVVTESHGRAVAHSSDEDAQFDFVFSNKTASDALCLAVRQRLVAQNLRVWQQKTNIPKDSENWFKEWYPSAISSKKIVCFVTAAYTKSEFCMKEFVVAQANRKLLVVACEPISVIRQVDARQYPSASDFLAYLDTGGQVICPERGLSLEGQTLCGDEDVIAQILKFQ